jgi:hypothetical protein
MHDAGVVGSVFPDQDETLGRLEAEGTEQNGMDDAEERRGGPDAEREREERHATETRALPEVAQPEPEVLTKGRHDP